MAPESSAAAPRLLIFDHDGVLVDSLPLWREFYNRLRRGVGLKDLSPAEERLVFPETLERGIALVIPPESLGAALSLVETMPWEELLAFLRPMPGVNRLLAFLRARGVLLAVDTNSGPELHAIHARLGWAESFDLVVTTREVRRAKPHPEGARLILARLGVAAGEAAFVGDSELDARAARGAGVAFWAFANPALEGARHFASHAEIMAAWPGAGGRA